jgi:hypothetical protein
VPRQAAPVRCAHAWSTRSGPPGFDGVLSQTLGQLFDIRQKLPGQAGTIQCDDDSVVHCGRRPGKARAYHVSPEVSHLRKLVPALFDLFAEQDKLLSPHFAGPAWAHAFIERDGRYWCTYETDSGGAVLLDSHAEQTSILRSAV